MNKIFGLALLVLAASAQAQGTTSAQVVSSCGSVTYSAGQARVVTQDTTGKLCTGASITPGGTQHVDGTGTAGTPAGGVLSVQGVSGGTPQPVSATTLPLPTGAATAANQTNVQSAAGTPDATVINVQGNASGVAMPVSAAALPLPSGAATSALQSSVQGPVAAGTAAANSQLGGAVYNSTPITLTTGQQAAAQSDKNGNTKISSPARTTCAVYVTGQTFYATPTIVWAINGSSTKKVELMTAQLLVSTTTAALQNVLFAKRSTANTGGTPTSLTPFPLDSGGSCTATVTTYGSTPTPGTLVNNLWTAIANSGAAATSAPGVLFLANPYTGLPMSNQTNVILNGTAEGVDASYSGAASTGAPGYTAGILVVWTEY